MNISRPDGSARALSIEPVRILVIGNRDRITQTIDHLCNLHFCDHADWSKIQPKPDEPGQFLSIMTKWYV
jgi:hypothetical protein